jgi:serine phosphatase RsbU (regulator of sigma subunit)
VLPRLPEWLPGIVLGADWPTSGRLAILAVLSLVSLTAGYVLMVTNLRATERESARAVAELELAGEVHRTLVPPIAASTPFAEVYGRSQASSSMGGDLIDLIITDTHADIILGDVSGHGVNAGIVMAMLKSSLRTALLGGADLAATVTDANRVLAELTAPNMFATLAGVRVRAAGAMEYTLAGHLPVFHRKAAGGEWVEYDNERLPLGIDGGETYPKVSVPVARGDVLVLLTDGLTEVQNAAGEELGLEGVRAILRTAPSEGPLHILHDSIISGVRAYGKAGDDQSLILLRIL